LIPTTAREKLVLFPRFRTYIFMVVHHPFPGSLPASVHKGESYERSVDKLLVAPLFAAFIPLRA